MRYLRARALDGVIGPNGTVAPQTVLARAHRSDFFGGYMIPQNRTGILVAKVGGKGNGGRVARLGGRWGIKTEREVKRGPHLG